jgi:hypothetical protein
MRFFGYLVLLALIAFGVWPYYYVFKLDDALSKEDTAQLAPLVDLPAIRANYKSRVAAAVGQILPPADPGTALAWIRENLPRLGDSALEQQVTLQWVRDTLREATSRATGQTPPSLISGIDFAFFESYNRFLIRIGDLARAPTHVRLSLEGYEWRVTDIIQ